MMHRNIQTAANALTQAIDACTRQDACEIMAEALARLSIGMPIAPFFSVMDEAKSWASFATTAECKAYCLACYDALPRKDQQAFVAYVQARCA